MMFNILKKYYIFNNNIFNNNIMSKLQEYYKTLDTGITNKINVKTVNGFNFEINKPCSDMQPLWGSEKPVHESCKPEHLQLNGLPCLNIWNNSTKRKTIVN